MTRKSCFGRLQLIGTESYLLAAAGPEHTPGAYPWDDSEYHKCVQATDGVAVDMAVVWHSLCCCCSCVCATGWSL